MYAGPAVPDKPSVERVPETAAANLRLPDKDLCVLERFERRALRT
jgi:hypothetical protein